MPELADKVTRSLFGKAAVVGLTFGRSVRTRIVDYFRRFGRLGWQNHLQAWIIEPMAVMRDHLHHTFMSAWIEGYDWVWGKLPPYTREELERPYRPPIILPPGTQRPPEEPPIINRRFADGPEEIRFPKIEEAAKRLIERNVLTRDQFDAASERIQSESFTMAGDLEVDAIQTVQETIARDIAQGTSLGSFEDQLSERLETSRLGAGHLENVYRTNVQSAFRDGRESLVSNPIVSETFPYQEYIHIGDTRVRSTHAQMSKLGLDGTGIYRRDDPVWDRFTPPWDYQCRCTVRLVTIEAAARAGVEEAKLWLETGRPPINPEHRINYIPFDANPGWGSRGRTGVFA
jgi:SPP1 gp7 family putative phage head morphogenesis protein